MSRIKQKIKSLGLRREDRIYADEIARNENVTTRTVSERWAKKPDFPKRHREGYQRFYWKPEDYIKWSEKPRG